MLLTLLALQACRFHRAQACLTSTCRLGVLASQAPGCRWCYRLIGSELGLIALHEASQGQAVGKL